MTWSVTVCGAISFPKPLSWPPQVVPSVVLCQNPVDQVMVGWLLKKFILLFLGHYNEITCLSSTHLARMHAGGLTHYLIIIRNKL